MRIVSGDHLREVDATIGGHDGVVLVPEISCAGIQNAADDGSLCAKSIAVIQI